MFTLAKEQLVTVRDVLRFAVSKFQEYNIAYGHGTDNAYDEAIFLILDNLHLPLDQLEPYLDARLLKPEISLLIDVIEKRIVERIPAAYLQKKAVLLGYEFYVDQRVIIPRSFIAEIIQNQQLSQWIEYPELVNNALDLCTGNGSLAVIMADNFYVANVVATDVSNDALAVAAINVDAYDLNDRIELINSDLFDDLSDYLETFDLIVTNPPYVDKSRMDSLSLESLHEPRLALSGGDSGLELVDKILRQAKHYLNECGILLLEMGDNRFELENLYPDLPFTWLETESGDGFVFVLTKQDLKDYFD